MVVSIQSPAGHLLADGAGVHVAGVSAGYLGAALGVSMVVPQIVRTVRHRALGGVSALSWALTALSCLSWLLYGVRTGELPQIPGNLLMITGTVAVVLAVPSVLSATARGVRLAAAALAVVAAATVLPAAAIGFVGLVIGLVSALPQTVESLTRAPGAASGVSLPAWVLRAASQVSWLASAVLLRDVTVGVSASVILASALALLAIEWHRREPRPVGAGSAALVAVPTADPVSPPQFELGTACVTS